MKQNTKQWWYSNNEWTLHNERVTNIRAFNNRHVFIKAQPAETVPVNDIIWQPEQWPPLPMQMLILVN